MRHYKLYQIDAFTKTKFAGNPAGVITNAEGLTDEAMQKIARELNNSETAFIFNEKHSEYDVQVRFFTPTHEVPICGHATIAAHYARAVEKQLGPSMVYHKTGAGVLPVEIFQNDGDYQIAMTQGAIEYGNILEGAEKDMLLAALSLSENDLLEDHPIQIVSTGHSKVMIGIKKLETLHNLSPSSAQLTQLSKRIQCNGYYVYTMASETEDILVHGRMFAPAIGIAEDPVTGNANGPLGAYLVHHRLVAFQGPTYKFKAIQGEAIQRMGIVTVEVSIEKNEPSAVKIYGDAVIAFQTELTL